MIKTGLAGTYNDQRLRSFAEYVYAVYLDKVENVKFTTEPFWMKSKINKSKKIPDFCFYDSTNKQIIVEIKTKNNEMEELICNYVNNSYDIPENSEIIFLTLNSTSKKRMIFEICEAIGKDAWDKMSSEYKQNSRKNNKFYGFCGNMNPRYGAIVSEETRKKISDSLKGKMTGENNPNYGNGINYSEESRKRIAAKWSDPVRKHNMKKKGMLTHIHNFTNDQLTEFVIYAEKMYNGVYCKKPYFLNTAYAVSKNKIDELFGNYENLLLSIVKDIK